MRFAYRKRIRNLYHYGYFKASDQNLGTATGGMNQISNRYKKLIAIGLWSSVEIVNFQSSHEELLDIYMSRIYQ